MSKADDFANYRGQPNPNDHELIAMLADQAAAAGKAEKATKAAEQNSEQQFLQKLIDTRVENNWRQVVLAERAGIKQSSIARLEAGKGNPTLKTLTKLADAMGYQLTLLRKPR